VHVEGQEGCSAGSGESSPGPANRNQTQPRFDASMPSIKTLYVPFDIARSSRGCAQGILIRRASSSRALDPGAFDNSLGDYFCCSSLTGNISSCYITYDTSTYRESLQTTAQALQPLAPSSRPSHSWPQDRPRFTDHARRSSCFSIWVSLLHVFHLSCSSLKLEDSIRVAIWGLVIRALG
jgi:hypothetical protein